MKAGDPLPVALKDLLGWALKDLLGWESHPNKSFSAT